MEKEFTLKHSRWKSAEMNCVRDFNLPVIGQQKLNSMLFESYSNPFGGTVSGNERVVFPDFMARNNLLNPSNRGSNTAAQRRFLVFDRSGDQTSLIFSSVGPSAWNLDPLNIKASETGPYAAPILRHEDAIMGSKETNVSEAEEVHEDTEEIDALLYSNTNDGFIQDEEEVASTGHSPVAIIENSEDAASSALPTKKRRLNSDVDASLVDTATSARVDCCNCDVMEFNCMNGVKQERTTEKSSSIAECSSKRQKRDRIREKVGMLRRIIPCGKGKDAPAVLDEAIRYLKSLKLRVKVL